MLAMGDWAEPGANAITGVDVVGFYIGGTDATHIWTAAEIKAQTVALMLPIWVYDAARPGTTNGTSDGNAAIAALHALGVPRGVRVVVDMEATVDAAYVAAFRTVVAAAGYWLTIYGSADFVFGNFPGAGPGGGFWAADWTGAAHQYNHVGVWATQYAVGGEPTNPAYSGHPWDLSEVSDLTHLWPHIPATQTLTAKAVASTGSAQRTANFIIA